MDTFFLDLFKFFGPDLKGANFEHFLDLFCATFLLGGGFESWTVMPWGGATSYILSISGHIQDFWFRPIDRKYILSIFFLDLFCATFLKGEGVEGGTVMPWGPQGVLGAQSVPRREPRRKRAPAPGA